MKLKFLPALIIIFLVSCNRNSERIPLSEHPRPDFEREVWQNLNGYWKFRPDSLNIGLTENWQDDPESFDHKILVPFSWAAPLSEIQMPDLHIGWYSLSFEVKNPEKWEGKNTWLVFCASDFNTTVWLNGTKIGSHRGGYVPFDFDVTKVLQKGENHLAVRVEDEELDNRPSGKQYYGNAKGIWQTVFIEGRPKNYISHIKYTPDIDEQIVTVELKLNDEVDNQAEFHLKGKNNSLAYRIEIPVKQDYIKFDVPVPEMKLWTLEDPFLYEVSASLMVNDIKDEVAGYFGMRKISAVEIPGKDFQYVALNNQPIYLKLSLDQSYHPEGFYTFPSDKFMKEEILRAKDLGLNGLRIHIKAEIPRKLYWADKLGLLIQEDIPNYWGEPDSTARSNWEYLASNQVERDYNHPSIFSWVLFNETWGLFTKDTITGKRSYLPETQDWVRKWYHNIKDYDPVRLVEDNSPCNWDHVITDINTWHRYSPARHWSGFLDMVLENTYPGSEFNFIGDNVQGNQPMFNSECGAVWGYSGSTGDIDITWEYHIMMNEFRKRPKIAGFLFTEFHDVINEWNGYYRFDRSKKDFGLDELNPGMTMKDFHQDLYIVPGESFFRTYRGGEDIEIPVGISAATNDIPEILILRYSVFGWDQLGDKFEYISGQRDAFANPFSYTELKPVNFKTPDETAVMILATILEDENGNVIQRNFLPFKVEGDMPAGKIIITRSSSDYTDASWSIGQHKPQKGGKVWGMGSGFFEYNFKLSDDISKEEIESIEFRAELASRYPQSKYLEKGAAERIGMTVVTEKGTDPGYGQNSYPQTDEKLHGSFIKVIAGDHKIAEEELTDDPADHRGILSWMNQEPGWEWGSDDHSIPWLLDEAGSYGFLISATLDEVAEKAAIEAGEITIRLLVDETSPDRGGLSVYGRESGRYPLDPAIVIYRK